MLHWGITYINIYKYIKSDQLTWLAQSYPNSQRSDDDLLKLTCPILSTISVYPLFWVIKAPQGAGLCKGWLPATPCINNILVKQVNYDKYP